MVEIFNLLKSVDKFSTKAHHSELFKAKEPWHPQDSEEELIGGLQVIIRNIIGALTAHSLQFADFKFLTKIGTLLDDTTVGIVDSAAHYYTAIASLADYQNQKMEDNKDLLKEFKDAYKGMDLVRDRIHIPVKRLFEDQDGFECYGYFGLKGSYDKLKAYIED
ncbi:hypothetical protein IWQ62_003813, partial [Dispira parvispora]